MWKVPISTLEKGFYRPSKSFKLALFHGLSAALLRFFRRWIGDLWSVPGENVLSPGVVAS